MLTWILLIVILFFLGAVFYKQTIQEYKLNQIEWSQADRLGEMLEEGTPFIVRSIPSCPVWRRVDVEARADFKELADWVRAVRGDGVMPWRPALAAAYGRQVNMGPWLDEIWQPHMPRIWSLASFLFPREVQVWAGGRGLYEQKAAWTMIFPTEGEVIVTMMSKKEDKYMPAAWQGRFADSFTTADSAYVSQLKYLDVKLRPGAALFVPAHWKVSFAVVDADADGALPFVCMINYHTPISKLASLGSASAVAVAPPKLSADKQLE